MAEEQQVKAEIINAIKKEGYEYKWSKAMREDGWKKYPLHILLENERLWYRQKPKKVECPLCGAGSFLHTSLNGYRYSCDSTLCEVSGPVCDTIEGAEDAYLSIKVTK